ncbi:hypothetical protein [Dongia rigui]|uniref:Rap1a immunity protein domain-containing protein n=1 Tax=Dongia rigui TaxID=940149 RepID=A0ABU5DZF7_9PROT|nr:hypothetical protein [Dongia rigui]MDY0872655.1 hypothetical protein [Dongia rigui]
MKWLALIVTGLFISSTDQAQQVQELHYSNGMLLSYTCSQPDKPGASISGQNRCIMLLDGLIGGIAYRANKEGTCLFNIDALPEMEKVRKQVVAWFELNKTIDDLNRSDASIVEEVLMKVYPCK